MQTGKTQIRQHMRAVLSVSTLFAYRIRNLSSRYGPFGYLISTPNFQLHTRCFINYLHATIALAQLLPMYNEQFTNSRTMIIYLAMFL